MWAHEAWLWRLTKEDALVKLQYDFYYIKHQSLWFDLVILIKTIIDTITFRGRA
jgi:lipopolysaccharide/colanic/teichoic acid biosynthesis glycosyltransferase